MGTFPVPEWQERRTWKRENDANYPQANHAVYSKLGNGKETYSLGYVYVLFAGKLYGGIKFKNSVENTTEMIWDVDTFNATVEKYSLFEKRKYQYSTYHSKGERTEQERGQALLTIRGDELLRDWAIEHNISTAVCGYDLWKPNEVFNLRPRKRSIFVIDPVLKDYNFQKVLDPFTAYQELDQWIGGVLGQNPQPEEVADKYKIQQHGYDKWSFRKHKLDNVK